VSGGACFAVPINILRQRFGLRFFDTTRFCWAAAFSAVAILAAPGAHAAAPPPSVIVTPVVSANIAPSISNIGHVIAIQSVKVIPRVTAFIDQVNVQQGSAVKTGEVLFTLQKAQYEAALQTAQANLESAQAALANAQLAYERASRLSSTGFEAESNLDQALATRNEDQANVLSAQASLANAQLNLSYCTITAPIDGRVGAVTLTKGNLVTTTTGALLTINQLDPIRVVFSVSSDSPILSAMQAGSGQAGEGQVGHSPYKVTLDLPDGAKYQHAGTIAFLDNQVDTSTGTVNVYADFPNPQSLLLPGAYVNVDTAPAKPEEALMVPVAAVQTDQNSSYVLVVGPDNKVQQQTITLGPQIGQNYVAKSGVALNDRVIVDGIQKVKVGQAVTPTVQAPAPTSTANQSNSSGT
jgi:membrane fusion protein (multidrug efflux system)